MTPGRKWVRKEFIFGVLLAVLSVFLCLVLVEVTVRIVAPERYLGIRTLTSVEDKTKIWAPPVNTVQYFRNPDTGQRITLPRNNLGLRMQEDVTASSLQGTRNIAFFGASFTENVRVPAAYSFPDVFKALLNTSQGRFQVLNFGVGNYGIGQSFLRYRELAADIRKELQDVIVVVSANDLWNSEKGNIVHLDDQGHLIVTPRGPRLPAFISWIRGFYLPYAVSDIFNGIKAQLWPSKAPVKKAKPIGTAQPQGKAIRLFNAVMLRWQADVVAAGGRFRLIVLPLENFESVMEQTDPRIPTIDLHRYIVDIVPDSLAATLVFRNDPHWNESGNLVAAVAIFNSLREEFNLPLMDTSQIVRLLDRYYRSTAEGWRPGTIGKLDFNAVR